MDDIEFNKTLKQSNQVIKEMMSELNTDALREAQELDQEVNFNNQEIQAIISSNKEDPDILAEFENLGKEENSNQQKTQQTKVINNIAPNMREDREVQFA